VDGRFGIKYEGYSLGSIGSNGDPKAELSGSFEISGCSGVPETTDLLGYFEHAIRPERDSTGNNTAFLKWVELVPRHAVPPKNDFTLENVFYRRYSTLPGILPFTPVLMQTPGIFKISPPWHLSYLDKLFLDGRFLPNPTFEISSIGNCRDHFSFQFSRCCLELERHAGMGLRGCVYMETFRKNAFMCDCLPAYHQ